MERAPGRVWDRLDPDAYRTCAGFTVLRNELNDLDGDRDHHLADWAAAAAIDIRVMLGPERNVGLIDFDDVGEPYDPGAPLPGEAYSATARRFCRIPGSVACGARGRRSH
jgi:hypothetical protein